MSSERVEEAVETRVSNRRLVAGGRLFSILLNAKLTCLISVFFSTCRVSVDPQNKVHCVVGNRDVNNQPIVVGNFGAGRWEKNLTISSLSTKRLQ